MKSKLANGDIGVLVHIDNQPLPHGKFPDSLKHARVLTLVKGGTRSNIFNSRPISILPSLSKTVEPAFYNRLSTIWSSQKWHLINSLVFARIMIRLMPWLRLRKKSVITHISYLTASFRIWKKLPIPQIMEKLWEGWDFQSSALQISG